MTNGDVEGLQGALENGFWSDDELNEALLLSARNGRAACYQLVAQSGASALSTNYSGKNALQLAIQYSGDIELIKMVLQTTSDWYELLDHTDSFNMTALSYAAWKGNVEALKEIVKIPQSKNDTKLLPECLEWESHRPRGTPLMIACRAGHVETVRYLISIGANVDQSSKSGWTTALMLACQKGNIECVRALLGGEAKVNDGDTWGTTALTFAAQGGYDNICKLIISKGADTNQGDRAGSSALLWAVSKGNETTVDTLINMGADIDMANDEGISPFIMSIKRDEVDIAQKLKELGADVTQIYRKRQTPIHVAAVKNKSKCLAYLLNADFPHKYDINALDKDGKTPLTLACERTYTSNVRVLLQHGADPNLRDGGSNGLSPLACAIRASLLYPIEGTQVVKELVSHGCDVNQRENLSSPYSNDSSVLCSAALPLEIVLHAGLLCIAEMLWYAGSRTEKAHLWSETNTPRLTMEALLMDDEASNKLKKDIYTFLNENVNQPRSLTNTSCIAIRRCLQIDIPNKVKKLGLPETLQETINIPELDALEKKNRQFQAGYGFAVEDEEILTDLTETSEEEESGLSDDDSDQVTLCSLVFNRDQEESGDVSTSSTDQDE